MIVKIENYKKSNITTFILVIVMLSCSDNRYYTKNEIDVETEKIISILIDTLSIDIPIPPPLNELNKNDSLYKITVLNKIKKDEKDVKIIAIESKLYSTEIYDFPSKDFGNDYNDLILKLKSLKNTPLVLNYFIENSKDSIIPFHDTLLDNTVSDYIKFDKLLSFSRIAFNEDYSLATIIASSSTSSRAGITNIYFLEKKKDDWYIKKSHGLWIY